MTCNLHMAQHIFACAMCTALGFDALIFCANVISMHMKLYVNSQRNQNATLFCRISSAGQSGRFNSIDALAFCHFNTRQIQIENDAMLFLNNCFWQANYRVSLFASCLYYEHPHLATQKSARVSDEDDDDVRCSVRLVTYTIFFFYFGCTTNTRSFVHLPKFSLYIYVPVFVFRFNFCVFLVAFKIELIVRFQSKKEVLRLPFPGRFPPGTLRAIQEGYGIKFCLATWMILRRVETLFNNFLMPILYTIFFHDAFIYTTDLMLGKKKRNDG